MLCVSIGHSLCTICYSIHNTLYLEVHCPTVKPQVVVISDNGRPTLDYGDVSIGQQMGKTITIQVRIGSSTSYTDLAWDIVVIRHR